MKTLAVLWSGRLRCRSRSAKVFSPDTLIVSSLSISSSATASTSDLLVIGR